MISKVTDDLKRYSQNATGRSFIRIWLISPGFRSVCFLRLQSYFYVLGRTWYPFKFVAHYIRYLNIRNFGLDVCLGCEIGSGLRIEHPVGIVIGAGVTIGKNATILQGVTIGERYVDERSDGLYPSIGDNVVVGVHTVILGGIKIGHNVTFGANSLVLGDVLSNRTIVGLNK